MKLLGKFLLLLAVAALLAAAKFEPLASAASTGQSQAFAPPNATWAHVFAGSRR